MDAVRVNDISRNTPIGQSDEEDEIGAYYFHLFPSGEGRLVGLVQLVRNSPYGQP
jgi:hypothetical protein